MTPSDEELLQAFIEGRRSTLADLAGRYEVALLNLSLAILGSNDLACDVVQETWLRVLRFADRFNGRSSFKTWLYRIAINQCRSTLAVRKQSSLDELKSLCDRSTDPADLAAHNDENARLKRAVESLSPPLQETILLCYSHGLTHAEAAEAMDIPLGTVKSRLNAALEQLRGQMKTQPKIGEFNHGY